MSPCTIRLLTPEGFQPAPYTAESLAEAARHEPDDGVYTLSNTFNTFQVLKLDAHLDRLEDSARREHIPLELDRAGLRAALRQMIEEAGYGDVRFRITVPRQQPGAFILSIEPFMPLAPEVYQQGVRCVTLPDSARQNPAAKSTAWMQARRSFTLPPGVHEGLLLNAEGEILEGMSSNFYAIINNTLYTAEFGILPGIAQQIVLAIAPGILLVVRRAVGVHDLAVLNETFITSSSRGIVPVVEIDGQVIGTGQPGGYTLRLREAYLNWVRAHLEDL